MVLNAKKRNKAGEEDRDACVGRSGCLKSTVFKCLKSSKGTVESGQNEGRGQEAGYNGRQRMGPGHSLPYGPPWTLAFREVKMKPLGNF